MQNGVQRLPYAIQSKVFCMHLVIKSFRVLLSASIIQFRYDLGQLINAELLHVIPACNPLQCDALAICDLNSVCVALSFRKLVLIFARQVLIKDSGITGDDDVQLAASIFVESMEELFFEHRTDVWEMPAGFSILQTFLRYICYHLSTCHLKYSLYGQKKNIPADLWIPL